MALTPGIFRRRQRFLVGSVAGSGTPTYQEFASIAEGIAGVADGEQFVVAQTHGVYHNLYTRNGSLATFNTVLPISGAATSLLAAITAEEAIEASYSFPAVDFYWRTRTAAKWDYRLVENVNAATGPTLNMLPTFLTPRDEDGGAGTTGPGYTMWPAVNDPLSNQEAIQIDFDSTADNFDFVDRSGTPSQLARMVTPLDLKLRVRVLQSTGTDTVRFGYSSNAAGKYTDSTGDGTWKTIDATVVDYDGTDTGDLTLRPAAAGTYTVYAYGPQIYDERGATDFPSLADERTAILAGHAKAPFAYPGALEVDSAGWFTPVAGSETIVAPLGRGNTSEWTMACWVDMTLPAASYSGSYAMAMAFARQKDDSNIQLNGSLGMDVSPYGVMYGEPGQSALALRAVGPIYEQGPVHLAVTCERIDSSTVDRKFYLNGVSIATSGTSITAESVSDFTPEFLVIGGYDAGYATRQDGTGKFLPGDKIKNPIFTRQALTSDEISAIFLAQREAFSVNTNHKILVVGSFDSNTQNSYGPFYKASEHAYANPGVFFYNEAVGGSKYGSGTDAGNYIGAERQPRRIEALKNAVKHYDRVLWLCQYGTNDLVSGVMDPDPGGDGWQDGRDLIDAMIFADIAAADPLNTGKIKPVLLTVQPNASLSADREIARLAYNQDCRDNWASRGYYALLDVADHTTTGFADLEAAAADAVANGTNAYFQGDGIHWSDAGGQEIADTFQIPFIETELSEFYEPDLLTVTFDTTHGLTAGLPLVFTGNVDIDWGDGTTETVSGSGWKTHTYASVGTYEASFDGAITQIWNASTNSAYLPLTRVERWGPSALTRVWFDEATNLVHVPADLPATVTSLNETFKLCVNFNSPSVSTWDTSNVTDLTETFKTCTVFNRPLPWDTSSVTGMERVFGEAAAFNQDLAWDTSAVTDMADMFRDASAFNGDISTWNTGLVANMANMFLGASVFNQDIGSWNVSSVTNFSNMFNGASAFNQDISGWNVSAGVNFSNMFAGAAAFNQPISNWVTTAATNMASMFNGATSFNQPLFWNTNGVTAMNSMFFGASSFNGNITLFDTSTVTTMNSMFRNASVFNQDIGAWDTGAVTDMTGMFRSATLFNQDLSGWDVTLIPTEPTNFALSSALTAPNKPVWGTAPSDVTAPTLVSTTPADNATGILTTVNLTATFSEPIIFGTGNITLRKNDGGWADVETFDVATEVGTGNGQVSIAGTVLTINPTSELAYGKEHAIRIASTAIKDDPAGNAFAGIANDTTWSFTTEALTAPVLSNFVDDAEFDPPVIAFDSDRAGTGTWDFHSSATPPTLGAGDIGTDTFSVVLGANDLEFDLSAYPGETGYLHIRVVNAAGTSNTLTTQQITVPGAGDVTAPVLTDNATVTHIGVNDVWASVTTDTAEGTIYAVGTSAGTAPTAAQVKSGLDNAGAAADGTGSKAVTASGSVTEINVTALTANAARYVHVMHEDVALNQSTVRSTAVFTTFDLTNIGTVTLTDCSVTSTTLTATAQAGTQTPMVVKAITFGASGSKTFYVDVKYTNTQYVILQVAAYNTAVNGVSIFDLVNTTVPTQASGHTATITSIPGGRKRCQIVFSPDGTDLVGSVRFGISESSTNHRIIDPDGSETVNVDYVSFPT